MKSARKSCLLLAWCVPAVALSVACGSKDAEPTGRLSQAVQGTASDNDGGGSSAPAVDAGSPPACGASVTATLTFDGSSRVDGTATLSRALPLVVPASIPITSGGSKNGHAQLQFSRSGVSIAVCGYSLHNAAASFSLDSCDDGATAGTAENADSLVLDIQNVDHGAGASGDYVQAAAVVNTTPGTDCTGVNASISVGSYGGHLVFPNGVVLDVPQGALSQNIIVGASVPQSLPGFTGDPAFVAAVQLEPEGIMFASSATLTIPLPAGLSTAPLSAYAMDDQTAFPSDDAGATSAQGDDAGSDDAGDDGGTEDDTVAEDLALPLTEDISAISPTSVQIFVNHFSVHMILQQQTGLLLDLSRGTIKGPNAHCTNASANTRELSRQILTLLPSSPSSVSLSPITPAAPGSTTPPWLYVATSSLKDLQGAMTDCSNDPTCGFANEEIKVKYAWRSLATQYVVQGACTPNPAGYPDGGTPFPDPGSYTAATGTSNHGQGLAVDVEAWPFSDSSVKELKAICVAYMGQHQGASLAQIMDYLFSPGIGETLFKHNWVWWGYFAKNTCADPVHFEYRSVAAYTNADGSVVPPTTAPPNGKQVFPLKSTAASSEANGDQIAAFQKLWNGATPCDSIDLTAASPAETSYVNNANTSDCYGHNNLGPIGPNTCLALEQAPGGGFPNPPISPSVGQGVLGDGCPDVANPAAGYCCVDAQGAHSCQVSSSCCPSGQVVCNGACCSPGQACVSGACVRPSRSVTITSFDCTLTPWTTPGVFLATTRAQGTASVADPDTNAYLIYLLGGTAGLPGNANDCGNWTPLGNACLREPGQQSSTAWSYTTVHLVSSHYALPGTFTALLTPDLSTLWANVSVPIQCH